MHLPVMHASEPFDLNLIETIILFFSLTMCTLSYLALHHATLILKKTVQHSWVPLSFFAAQFN